MMMTSESRAWPCWRRPPGLLKRLALGAALLAGLAGLTAQAAAATTTVRTEQVRAELVAHAPQGVAAGKPVWLGLRIEHQPHWHTYWKNPGDSGLATSLSWTLPAGFAAGGIVWPTPQQLPVGPLMNFGYEGTLLLPVPVTVPADFKGASLPVRLEAQWLVCKDVCIPESGEFALEIPAQAATVAHTALFDAARAATPRIVPGVQAQAVVGDTAALQALQVRVQGLPAAWQGQKLRFFPETAGVIDNAAAPTARWQDGTWVASVPLSAQRSESPTLLPAVLTREGEAAGVQLTVSVSGAWPAAGSGPAAPEHGDATGLAKMGDGQGGSAATSALSLAWALLLALVGGALLNLMPCVFPVLSLKVFGFTAHAQDRRALLAGGLAYTGGVVVSFLALAGLLLALRAGGEQLGWGFQLQSPGFVAGLAILFSLIGLNLAGVFELGNLLPSSLAAARARHPVVDSALTGVLAVAVASPCTAPFMGASLGLAVTLPTGQALAIFAALGLGLALPYLLASAWPGLARALPRPGPWMVTFKTLMAFPMFATVVWLAWVLGQQAGVDAVAGLLGVLLALAFAAWAWGLPTRRATTRVLWWSSSALLLAATIAWAWPSFQAAPVGPATGSGSADNRIDSTQPGRDAQDRGANRKEGRAERPERAEDWQPWSPERVQTALASGRPVFVDFTAAWCVTCQFNKRTTLADAQVHADFAAKRVVLLRADWTRRDPAITAALAQLGRNGVPVYLLQAPGGAAPRVLSEVLSVREVREALAGLP
jgi:thiol:disulfide interchange protein DsbD